MSITAQHPSQFQRCVIVTFRLLNLYAEECAIEDTTYYLDKALMDNVVDIETYLKVNIVFESLF